MHDSLTIPASGHRACAAPAVLIVATGNQGKLRELERLFRDSPWRVVAATAVGGMPDVDECADSLRGNAALKARAVARRYNGWALADDTGLEVKALDGAPGVHSARYAGPNCDRAANMRKLLAALAATPDGDRTARFACCLAVADPQGAVRAEAQGQCTGRILRVPRGGQGFGYDPLFEVVEYRRTFAELGAAAKAMLSHRARAVERLRSVLLAMSQDAGR